MWSTWWPHFISNIEGTGVDRGPAPLPKSVQPMVEWHTDSPHDFLSLGVKPHVLSPSQLIPADPRFFRGWFPAPSEKRKCVARGAMGTSRNCRPQAISKPAGPRQTWDPHSKWRKKKEWETWEKKKEIDVSRVFFCYLNVVLIAMFDRRVTIKTMYINVMGMWYACRKVVNPINLPFFWFIHTTHFNPFQVIWGMVHGIAVTTNQLSVEIHLSKLCEFWIACHKRSILLEEF